VLDPHEAFILGLLREKPDTTLEEMAERLAAERGVRVDGGLEVPRSARPDA